MADVEVFKLVLNGGSFGLVVILVLWALFKASPALQGTIERMQAQHAAACAAMTADHRTTMTAMAEAHKATVATLAREFREALTEMDRSSRAERAEILERFDAIVEKDRDSRHATASQFTAAVNHLAVSQMKSAGGRKGEE